MSAKVKTIAKCSANNGSNKSFIAGHEEEM